MERRLAAIVAADVVGYTRLMGEDEAGTLERLKTVRTELIQPQIAERNGRIVKFMGDGLLAEFPSVVEAVQCAIDIQELINGREAEVPDERRIRLRIGINLGDVMVEGSDIYGDGVNVASRLEGLAEPGSIYVSGAAFDVVDGKLDLAFEDMGLQEIKNVAKPVRAHRLMSDATIQCGQTRTTVKRTVRDKPSIAVLPFANLSGDPEQDFLSCGIAEDIITALSKIGRLRVIARNSTFAYKGASPNLREVASDLGVQYVLVGGVRRSGDRLRITAQLIDADDSSHLWAEQYELVVHDLFDVQDEITKKIVTALRVNLTDGELAKVWARGTSNIEAWQCCVRGFELYMHFDSSSYLEARSLAERATRLDPEYAYAWALLGFTYWWEGRLGLGDDPEAKFSKAETIAERAMGLDDTVSWVIGLTAVVALAQGHREESVRIAGRGVRHNPGSADNLAFLSYCLFSVERFEEAVENMRAAMRLNPYPPNWYLSGFARSLAALGAFEEALYWADRLAAAEPDYLSIQLLRAFLLMQLGREDTARLAISRFREIAPHFRLGQAAEFQYLTDDKMVARSNAALRKAGLPW